MSATLQDLGQERVRAAMHQLPPNVFLSALSRAEREAGYVAAPPAVPAAPYLEMMLAPLKLEGSERVLEVGSPSGYETALLSLLAGDVVSLHPDSEVASARLKALLAVGCSNVRLFLGHGPAGWPGEAPYHAILIAGATPRLPMALLDQLDIGGRLVAPLGDATGQMVEVLRKRADGVTARTLGPSRLPVLPWATERPSFFPWNRDGAAGPSR